MSTVTRYTSLGFIHSGFSFELRYRIRKIPAVTFCANPFGHTSTSFAVKSVSTADELTCKSALIGPVTSMSCVKAGVVNTSTSLRASAGR